MSPLPWELDMFDSDISDRGNSVVHYIEVVGQRALVVMVSETTSIFWDLVFKRFRCNAHVQ